MSFGRRSAFATLIAVALLAGCGGGEDEDTPAATAETTTTTRPEPPQPTQPLSEQIPIFERVVADPNCEEALEVIHPVLLSKPDEPTSKRNCGDAVYPIRAEQGLEITDSAELGTGAIVDTVLDGQGESLIWALDAEGRFKWTGSFLGKPQVGTEPFHEPHFEETAVTFVEALRDEDCKAAFATFPPDSRLGQNGQKAFCKSFADTFTAEPEGFGSRLQEDPEAAPELLGASKDLAFYGLSTVPAGYRTMIVGHQARGVPPLLIDVIPTER